MSLTAEGCAGGFAGFRLCPSAMVSVVIEAGKDDEGLARWSARRAKSEWLLLERGTG